MDIRPNHTIYINNVNDKIKKEGKKDDCGFEWNSFDMFVVFVSLSDH